LTTTRLTSEHLALTSDDVKYTPVAVGESADWYHILQ